MDVVVFTHQGTNLLDEVLDQMDLDVGWAIAGSRAHTALLRAHGQIHPHLALSIPYMVATVSANRALYGRLTSRGGFQDLARDVEADRLGLFFTQNGSSIDNMSDTSSPVFQFQFQWAASHGNLPDYQLVSPERHFRLSR